MTSSIEKRALKVLIDNHKKTFNAPLGQRKCKFELATDCLGTDDESLFKGRMCKRCVKKKLRMLYDIRVANRGYPRQKPGPKPKVTAMSDTDDETKSRPIVKVRQRV